MTMEEYFVKELQEEKEKRENLERKVRELEDERRKIEDGIRECEWLVKKSAPRLTKSGYIFTSSAMFADDDVNRAMRVFARLGVQVGKDITEEVETR